MKTKYKVPKSLVDKLQAAVDYLTEHPEKIVYAWEKPQSRKGGSLFRHVHPHVHIRTTSRYASDSGRMCGCLTQVRTRAESDFLTYVAYTPELTQAVLMDGRLPESPWDITVAHLPIFMEWMLKLAVIFEWKS